MGIAAGVGALIGVALGMAGVVAIACVILGMAAFRRSIRPGAPLAVAVVAGLLGMGRGATVEPAPPAGEHLVLPAHAIVVDAPISSRNYQHFVISEIGSDDATTRQSAPERFCVASSAIPEVSLGDQLELDGDAELAIDASTPMRAYLNSRNCEASAFASDVKILSFDSSMGREIAELRRRLGMTLQSSVPGDAGILLTGLVTGDDAGFSPEREDAFQRTGTTHLTAVSGSNLALVAGIFATVGAATFGRHRVPWQALTVGGIWFYALVAGLQPPAIRAAIVVTAAIFAFVFGRRPDFVTLIVVAAGLMALLDPSRIEALGFRLSVAASLAIAVVLPALMERGQLGPLAGALAATTAAQLATLPFLLPIFGTVSLLGIPANVLVAPLTAMAMPLAALAALAGLVWQPLGEIVAAPAGMIANVTLAIVDGLGAEETQVRLGIPPLSALGVIGMTCVVLVFALNAAALPSGMRRWRSSAKDHSHSGDDRARPAELRVATADLATSSPAIFRGEDPADTLAADLDDAKEHPPGQEDIHEVAENRQSGKAVP